MTTLRDRASGTRRDAIFLAGFPIARWIVANWWAMLHEPLRGNGPPEESVLWRESDRLWLARHDLRTADSGAMLPSLRIRGEGERIALSWIEDPPDAYPSNPGYFLSTGSAHLRREDVEVALEEFVSGVLSVCADLPDPRVEALTMNWRAIREADPEERAFCRAAGTLGLDPYSIDDWSAGMADFLESGLAGDLERPFGRDFLEAVRPERAPRLWTPLSESVRALVLTSGRVALHVPASARRAKDLGYAAARAVRSALGLGVEPVRTLARLSESLGFGAMAVEAMPAQDCGIRGAVGWHGRVPVLGASESRPLPKRFLEARALFMAALVCGSGPRLLTNAITWDQAASRAFAAELLAPQAGLERLDPDADWEDREAAITRDMDRYEVEREVIRRQRENSFPSVG